MKNVIILNNINKKYIIYNRPIDRLYAMAPWNKNKSLGREHWALKDINLEVAKGEVVGIVGRNGAGKSTLLQIICNTLKPSSGDVIVNGKVSALLELGSGFNHEFSGRENIYLSAAIAGMGRSDIDAKYNEIVEFSEIGDYIDQPVKTYSSGMIMRLAFSVATSVSPDILVIDEALSVGDGAFARKSFDRIMSLKDMGATIFFCSHNLYQVKTICKRALWLKDGKIEFFGDANMAIDKYQEFLDLERQSMVDTVTAANRDDTPNLRYLAQITHVGLKKTGEVATRTLHCASGVDDICIEIAFRANCPVEELSVAWLITDTMLRNISSASTFSDAIPIKLDKEGRGDMTITIHRCPLMKGEYLLHAFLMSPDDVFYYDSAVNACTLHVSDDSHVIGVVKLPRIWES